MDNKMHMKRQKGWWGGQGKVPEAVRGGWGGPNTNFTCWPWVAGWCQAVSRWLQEWQGPQLGPQHTARPPTAVAVSLGQISYLGGFTVNLASRLTALRPEGPWVCGRLIHSLSQVLALNNLRISKLPGEVGGKTGTATSQVAALTVCLRPEKTSKGLCLKC